MISLDSRLTLGWGGPLFPLPRLELLMCYYAHLALYMGSGDLNSGPYVGMVNVLTIGP